MTCTTTIKKLIAEQLQELESKHSDDFRLKLVDSIKDELLWAQITANSATRRKVLHTNISDCEELYSRLRRLSKYVDSYENVLKGTVDSYSADFIKKELKKKVTALVEEEVNDLPWDQLSYE